MENVSRQECQEINKSMAEQIKEVKKVVDNLTIKVNGLPDKLRLEMMNANAELMKQITENQATMLKEIKKSYSAKWVEDTIIIIIKILGSAALLGAAGYFVRMMFFIGKN